MDRKAGRKPKLYLTDEELPLLLALLHIVFDSVTDYLRSSEAGSLNYVIANTT